MKFSITASLLFALALFSNPSFAQYFNTDMSNQDLLSSQEILIGQGTEAWTYVTSTSDPGYRPSIGLPFSLPYLIFDSENIINNRPGEAEEVAIATPEVIDVSGASNVFLSFDHLFTGGTDAAGRVEIRLGSIGAWQTVANYTDSMETYQNVMIDITNLVESSPTNVYLRFVWECNPDGYFWVIDNVQVRNIYDFDVAPDAIVAPVSPVDVGVNPITISVINNGVNDVTAMTIEWSVNGIAQPPYQWQGNISMGDTAFVTMGDYLFSPGAENCFTFTVTQLGANSDNYPFDNSFNRCLSAALCGDYDIGGPSPDFVNFTQAAYFLNTYGITCPVVFYVYPGEYVEQIRIFDIEGSSEINTITFTGVSGNSNDVFFHYDFANANQDYTVKLEHAKHIRFENMKIARGDLNSSTAINNIAIRLNGNNTNIRISNCYLGNVLAEADGYHENMIFDDNNSIGSFMTISQLTPGVADSIVISNSRFKGLNVSRSTNVHIYGNESILSFGPTNPDTLYFLKSFSNVNLKVYDNNFRYFNFINDTLLNFYNNIVGLSNNYIYESTMLVSIDCVNSDFHHNQLYTRFGINVTGANSDSVFIRHNLLECTTFLPASGIQLNGVYQNVFVDSNTVRGFLGSGLYSNAMGSSNIRFRGNVLENGSGNAIRIEGSNGVIVEMNRIRNYKSGNGISIAASQSKVRNNYIHMSGVAPATGILLDTDVSFVQVYFNSVLIECTDIVTGIAFQIKGGSNCIVKNNSFVNMNGGYAFKSADNISSLQAFMMNRNNYYSLYNRLARFAGIEYSDIGAFASAIGQEANSFNVNPMYTSSSVLQVNHPLLNNVGESINGIPGDIDLTQRGVAPDIGAKEYTPCSNDAGLNGFVNLENPLSIGNEIIIVTLQNMGNNTLTSANIGWSVNGVPQPNANWVGNLAVGQSVDVSLGIYGFNSNNAFLYNITAYTLNANGEEDCNHLNDTIESMNLSIPLCGILTLGSQPNDDFESFEELNMAINAAGIICNTVVRVRSGFYDERLILYDIEGTDLYSLRVESFVNNRDSVILQETEVDPTSDFTVLLGGTRRFWLEDISIFRPGGTSVFLTTNASNISIGGCALVGHVVKDQNSASSNLYFAGNYAPDVEFYFNSAVGVEGDSITLRDNLLLNAFIYGFSKVYVRNNHRYDYSNTSYCHRIGIMRCTDVEVLENSSSYLSFRGCENLKVSDNYSEPWDYYQNYEYMANYAICVEGCNNVEIIGNTSKTIYPIICYGGTNNVRVSRNHIIHGPFNVGLATTIMYGLPIGSAGIRMDGPQVAVVDSNIIEGLSNTYGLYCNMPAGSNWDIKGNIFRDICGNGIEAYGSGGRFEFNRIQQGRGGIGLYLKSSNSKIFNNWIHSEAGGSIKGILIDTLASSNIIAFNSINIKGSDAFNSRAIEIRGGNGTNTINNVVKNNIFCNSGSGFAAAFYGSLSQQQLDYNNYFSLGNSLILQNSTLYNNLNQYFLVNGPIGGIHSLAMPPLFVTDTLLISGQSALDGAGTAFADVDLDILGVERDATNPDIGATEFTLCDADVGLSGYGEMNSSVASGLSVVEVTLQNQGFNTLDSTIIYWSINGLEQTPLSWSGNLISQGTSIVQLGTVQVLVGEIYVIRAWVSTFNGGADCNVLNDSLPEFQLYRSLCGIYTIGASELSDFSTFTEAAIALNDAGISCNVTFQVEDGYYPEQVEIREVAGASELSQVFFESQNSDSSLVILENPLTDLCANYTLSLNNADYINISEIGIKRPGNFLAVDIKSGSDHLNIQNCSLGSLSFNPGAINQDVWIAHNNVNGYDINADFFNGGGASEISFVGNFLRNLNIDHVENLVVADNAYDPYGNYAFRITINNSSDISLTGNKASYFGIYNGNNVLAHDNATNDNESPDQIGTFYGFEFLNCVGVDVRRNVIRKRIGIKVHANTFTDDIVITENQIIKEAQFDWSVGMECSHVVNHLLIDTNVIKFHNRDVLYLDAPANSNWHVTRNVMEGSGDIMELRGYNILVEKNRVLFSTAANLLSIYGQNMVVMNNYLHAYGSAPSKGIVIQPGADNVQLYFNSVFMEAQDGFSSSAIEILGDSTTGHLAMDVRNNIFANKGNGDAHAARYRRLPNELYSAGNCYFTLPGTIGSIGETSYTEASDWNVALLGQDVISQTLFANPLLETALYSDSILLPYQRLINGRGLSLTFLESSLPNILYDIDGEIRNENATDIGAQEFEVDFGVVDLLLPNLECAQSASESVTVALRQFGDIPFQDIVIAFQVNNGSVYTETIPGQTYSDIDYTFQNSVDLSAYGVYEFKFWLVNNIDDNINNDTLRITRYSSPSPTVNFTFQNGCANDPISFNGTASVVGGVITGYEWDFGDDSVGVGQMVSHIYDQAGLYPVTMRAYRDSTCYSDTTKNISLLATPEIEYEILPACAGVTLDISNYTMVLNGNQSVVYNWNFGNGVTLSGLEPNYSYPSAGVFSVLLNATATNGCNDTLSQSITVNPNPIAVFDLINSYPVNYAPIVLEAQPPGGVFSGPGVANGVFDPSQAGQGNRTIVYTYTDAETGCTDTDSEVIFVSPYYDPPLITTQPVGVSVCAGEPAVLFAIAGGEEPLFQWYRNGVAIAGATSQDIFLPEVNENIAGLYHVMVFNDYDSVYSDSVEVSIGISHEVYMDTVLCYGEVIFKPTPTQLFTINSSGEYALQYENSTGCDSIVYLTVTSIFPTTSVVDTTYCAPFIFHGEEFNESGTYTVIIENTVGCDSVITLIYNRAEIYSSCDDGNDCTINDYYINYCTCVGELTIDEDDDGLCQALDLCPSGPEPGSTCFDGDFCTINDVVNADCQCVGDYYDTDGDEVCDSLEVSGCADILACNYNPLTTDDIETCIYPMVGYDCSGNCIVFVGSECISLGCTNPMACNFNDLANVDDNSCVISGCIDANACNYNDVAGCDNGSCIYPGCTNELACNYDGSAGCDDGSCQSPGCMDELACNYDAAVACESGTCIYPGCIDSLACNYDADALCGGGICEVYGCTNPISCNFNEMASCDDGSCLFPGCADSIACNFDFWAGCNDPGMCKYSGCMDSSACNFDSTAICEANEDCIFPQQFYNCDSMCLADEDNDGICDPLEVYGCMDESACNFDSLATEESYESDSCVFPEIGYYCDGSCLADDDQDQVCNLNELPGCQDITACNYNPLATDSGTCEYIELYLIDGPIEVFVGDTVQYTYPFTEGSLYDWTVSSGEILSGDSTNQIMVVFIAADSQLVSVAETTQEGCVSSDSVSYLIVYVGGSSVRSPDLAQKVVPVVFPNPVDEFLSVKSYEEWIHSSWCIYNSMGRIIKSGDLKSLQSLIEVSELSAGAYRLEFTNKSGIRTSTSFIKK